MPYDTPTLPWYTVVMDIMQFRGQNYLLVVDCMSHFPELCLLGGKTAQHVVMALKSMFSIHGMPKSIMADNMPFTSHVMKQFGKDWCFDIVTSSPHYYQ